MRKLRIDWTLVGFGIYAMMFLLLIGCKDGKLDIVPDRTFSGSITINQTNGDIQSVKIDFPDSVSVSSRKDLSNLLDEVKALVVEMESARDRMKVVEPKVK